MSTCLHVVLIYVPSYMHRLVLICMCPVACRATPLISVVVRFAACCQMICCCSRSLPAVPCLLYRCRVMTRVAALHWWACGVLATPPPPRGGPLLTSCCALAACPCFQVTACMPRRVPALLPGPGAYFLRAGALRASLFFVVLLQPCLHIMLVRYSDLVNMCTDYCHNHS
jgi:hypothetical protein